MCTLLIGLDPTLPYLILHTYLPTLPYLTDLLLHSASTAVYGVRPVVSLLQKKAKE